MNETVVTSNSFFIELAKQYVNHGEGGFENWLMERYNCELLDQVGIKFGTHEDYMMCVLSI